MFSRFFDKVIGPATKTANVTKSPRALPYVPTHVLRAHMSPGAYFSVHGGARFYDVEELKPEPESEYAYWQERIREAYVAEAAFQLEEAQKKLEDLRKNGKF